MKTIFYSILLSVILFSCKKQTDLPSPVLSKTEVSVIDGAYLARVRNYLLSRMPDSLYKSLDTTSRALTRESSCYFRVGFTGRPMDERFVLLTTDSAGNVSDGRIIELSRAKSAGPVFNGELRIRTITGESLMESPVTNGFVDAWNGKQARASVNSAGENMYLAEEPVYEELPEVIVYPDAGGGMSASDIYFLLSGLGGSGYGNGFGMGTGYSIAGGSVIYTRAAAPATSPVARAVTGRPVILKVETSYKNPAINVKSFLNCFGSVPDAGASYSVNVYVDLPVDNEPSQFFDPYTGATGHVFLGLAKTSGNQSVTQYMGFTAANALSAITSPQAVAGKVVDNSGHKYSAMLSTPVTAAEFSAAMNKLQSQSSAQYDIVNYNCVDFALGVVNSARGNYPLVISKYPVPDEPTPMSTPEALYNTISSMSRAGGPEAGNTNIGNVWSAGSSHGACN